MEVGGPHEAGRRKGDQGLDAPAPNGGRLSETVGRPFLNQSVFSLGKTIERWKMAQQLQEITGRFDSERQRFENTDDDCLIGRFWINNEAGDPTCPVSTKEGDKLVSVKVTVPRGTELVKGVEYRLFGKWSSYTNKRTGKVEDQFAAQSYVEHAPVSAEAIIHYLAKYGEGCGVGIVRATLIYNQYGKDAVKTCRGQPEAIAELLAKHGQRVSIEDLTILAARLEVNRVREQASIELNAILMRRGFPRRTVDLAFEKWGLSAAQRIKADPFMLMELPGCGFLRCDQMWLELGLPRQDIRRQSMCAYYYIDKMSDGSIWLAEDFAYQSIKKHVGSVNVTPLAAVESAIDNGWLSRRCGIGQAGELVDLHHPAGRRFLAVQKDRDNEDTIAKCIREAKKELAKWPDATQIEHTTSHQRTELQKATREIIGVFCGCGGTGKTHTVARLLKTIEEHGDFSRIAVMAPTGKAAARLTENMAKAGVHLIAKTFHSHYFMLKATGLNEWQFDLIIVDESSMIDAWMMAEILKNRPRNCHVLFVGDIHQLPPVGKGCPLRDMIAAGVPTGELRAPMRNTNGVMEACMAIRDCQPWAPINELSLVECRPESVAMNVMIEYQRFRNDPEMAGKDITVLCATNRLRQRLNQLLQDDLNPGGFEIPYTKFRIGDRVVCTKNQWRDLDKARGFDDGAPTRRKGNMSEALEVYCANGELGSIVAANESRIWVEFEAPKKTAVFFVPRKGKPTEAELEAGEEVGDDEDNNNTTLDLGYALSVHKSQGSEWWRVLVILETGFQVDSLCDRSWIYTAISRAKGDCVLIGNLVDARMMCNRSNISRRKTFLKDLIANGEPVKPAELEGIEEIVTHEGIDVDADAARILLDL